jgi:formate dehydrogenase major subunit
MCLVEIDGMRGYPASCTTPVSEGMVVRTRRRAGRPAPQRDGAVHLRPPAGLPDLLGQRQLRAADRGRQVGLREVRYGYDGANHREEGRFQPVFRLRPEQVHRLQPLRARLRNPGHLRPDHYRARFRVAVAAAGGDDFLDSECVSCGACVQACPTATLTEKSLVQLGQPERSVITTCAYCGVGCSFRAEMKGDQLVRMVPDKNGRPTTATPASRAALPGATPPTRTASPSR